MGRLSLKRLRRSVVFVTVLPVRLLRQRPVRVALYIFGAGLLITFLDPHEAVLVPYLLWSVPSNSLLMIPNEPGALAAVQLLRKSVPLVEAAVTIGFVGALGAGIAAILDYTILSWVADHDRVQGWIGHPRSQHAIKLFKNYPFLTVVIFAFFPLPFFVARFTAIAARYSLPRYSTAVVIGKFFRFSILGIIGGIFVLPTWAVAVLFVGLLVIGIIPQIRASRRGYGSSEVVGEIENELKDHRDRGDG